MIQWNTKGEKPQPGQRILIKLPDGRVCSCTVAANGDGIHLDDYIDSMDLMALLGTTIIWHPLESEPSVDTIDPPY
jgi:hypothetical protein